MPSSHRNISRRRRSQSTQHQNNLERLPVLLRYQNELQRTSCTRARELRRERSDSHRHQSQAGEQLYRPFFQISAIPGRFDPGFLV
jgi:hypothetical protein